MIDTHGQRVLLIDDDVIFTTVLARALQRRGFVVDTAPDSTRALLLAKEKSPDAAVLDLKLGVENGLALIPLLLCVRPGLRILLLTGYASIATAVEAIRRGAFDYLAKPVDADQVAQALLGENAEPDIPDVPDQSLQPLPLRRLEWEHIQRILTESDGNISKAARRLGMHRRTLQRKLSKHPVQEKGR
ncbi:MAG: response regulator [Rhodanobacter sp.]|jgi:two-component system response regulator RegA|nr:response regulator [Rhodanobacter sp.]